MYLNEIMEEIAERSGHTLSDVSILRKINQIQGNIYRNYVKTTTYSKLDIQSGLSEYPLPRPMGTIIDVVVNGLQYTYSGIKEERSTLYYYILDGTIGLSATPPSDVTGGLVIFHKKAPHLLNINDMEAIPDLDEDYHNLLVYGPLADLLTGDKSLEYKARYDGLLREFQKAIEPPEYPQMKAVYTI
jgi:hypothetical protein